MAGLLLAVEVVSHGSELTDRVIKKAEYAKAGIGRYWLVGRDGAIAVHRYILNGEAGQYEPGTEGSRPLARLLGAIPGIY